VWHSTLGGIATTADVHHQFGDVLELNIAVAFKALQQDALATRSAIVAEAKTLSLRMEKELDALEKVRGKYEKAEAKAKKAYEDKKESEKTGKGNPEKLHKKWADLSRAAEGEEKLLKGETDRVNDVRVIFYHNTMRKTLDRMEVADQEVAGAIKSQLYEIGKAFNGIQVESTKAANGIHVSVQNFNAPNDTTLFTKVVLQGQAPQALPGHLPLHPSRQLGYTNTTPAAAPATAMNSSSGTSYYTRESSVREMASPEASAEYETVASGGGGGASGPSAPPPPPPPPQAPSYGACQALYAFPGAQQGEIAVAEGETLDMIEDDGSGWVLAGKRDGSGRQGFVPATYIQKL